MGKFSISPDAILVLCILVLILGLSFGCIPGVQSALPLTALQGDPVLKTSAKKSWNMIPSPYKAKQQKYQIPFLGQVTKLPISLIIKVYTYYKFGV